MLILTSGHRIIKQMLNTAEFYSIFTIFIPTARIPCCGNTPLVIVCHESFLLQGISKILCKFYVYLFYQYLGVHNASHFIYVYKTS